MNRIYVNDESIIVHDPTPVIYPFLKAIDPSYEITSIRPDQGFIPKFQDCKKQGLNLNQDNILEYSLPELMDIHRNATCKNASNLSQNSINLLGLKKEIAFRQIRECRLCARECGVNRYIEKGRCGLDYRAYHTRPFIHIGEEDVIRRAIIVNFNGCSLDCVFCIDNEHKETEKQQQLNVDTLWESIRKLMNQGNTLEFAGGNPTESLPWILEILSRAPEDFNMPIVWNSNLYATDLAIDLLNRVVDVYLPDFNFGNNDCAKRLSGVDNYWDIARNVAKAIISRRGKIIFRILVLPNHIECCHKPVLEFLSHYREQIWVSILDQYVPEHQAYLYSDISKRPTSEDVSRVKALVEKYNLRNITNDYSDFWLSR